MKTVIVIIVAAMLLGFSYRLFQVDATLTGEGTADSPLGVVRDELRLSGTYSESVTTEPTQTVTIGATMDDAAYRVVIAPQNSLSAAQFYVTNKTTTTFDVEYLSGLTGTVSFDWILIPN